MSKKVLVVLDPGHVGSTYNKGAVSGYYESAAVWKLSQYEKAALEKYGIKVIITKKNINDDIELYDRGHMAVENAKGYDAVVFESNHTNAANGNACGVTIIRSKHLDGSVTLANKIINAVVSVMRPVTGVTYNRGITTKTQSNGADWYGVIRGAVSGTTCESKGPVMYAYIVEHGFHDNLKECQFLAVGANLKKIAEAKAKAIADYFGLSKISTTTPTKPATPTAPTSKFPYKVRVKVTDLYIRKGPGTSYGKNGFIKPGVYTITAEKSANGYTWGKLKSGAGWIALKYTEKV